MDINEKMNSIEQNLDALEARINALIMGVDPDWYNKQMSELERKLSSIEFPYESMPRIPKMD